MDKSAIKQLLTNYSPLLQARNALTMLGNAGDIVDTGKYAQEQGIKRFPKTTQATREVDAYRHLVWQALLAKKYGKDVAELAGNFHENPFIPFVGGMGQPKDQQQMDLYNNMLGRDLANMSEEEIMRMAEELIKSGQAKLDSSPGSY